jgi:hypothetical protein
MCSLAWSAVAGQVIQFLDQRGYPAQWPLSLQQADAASLAQLVVTAVYVEGRSKNEVAWEYGARAAGSRGSRPGMRPTGEAVFEAPNW